MRQEELGSDLQSQNGLWRFTVGRSELKSTERRLLFLMSLPALKSEDKTNALGGSEVAHSPPNQLKHCRKPN